MGRILLTEEAIDWESRLLDAVENSPVCGQSGLVYSGDMLAVQSMLTDLVQYATSLMRSNIEHLDESFISVSTCCSCTIVH